MADQHADPRAILLRQQGRGGERSVPHHASVRLRIRLALLDGQLGARSFEPPSIELADHHRRIASLIEGRQPDR